MALTNLSIDNIEGVPFSIDEIAKTLKSNFPKADINKLKRAYEFAKHAHDGQFRKSGEEYINHPLFVAFLTAQIKLDEDSVIAALLHDTIEDTGVTISEIEELYGKEVAFLVDGLTKIKTVTKKVRATDYDFTSLRRLLIASTKDIRVILIKLADRLHNIMTVGSLPAKRQKDYAEETIKFYAPLADFVGINFFRKKLEDYSFKTIEPRIYRQIQKYLDTNKVIDEGKMLGREDFIHKNIETFKTILKDAKIRSDVFGRTKGAYSIYRKIVKAHKDFDISYMKDINDLAGITILVGSISECYKVLGLMHAKYEHIPYLFDDYVAKPKDNGYRSIHTCLVNNDGVRIALQIKTQKMQEYNEYGPASHIYYKERERSGPPILGAQLNFLRSLVRWREQIANIEYYKVDIFKDKVFVFTPGGDVKELPQGATAIDFAYLVHTNVGNSCKGVKVNNVIKPLEYELHTGDIVEILIDKKKHMPSHDWLSFVKTPYAKANIRRALRSEEPLPEDIPPEEIEEEVEEPPKLETSGEKEEFVKTSEGGIVRIKGIDGIDCSIAKCCGPIPGDDIIGHVTKTRGIKIHKKDCKELAVLEYKVLLEAEWVKTQQEFLTGLYIQSSSLDTAQMIKDISKLLSDMKIEVQKMDSWNNNGFNGKIAVNVTSKGQLENLIKKIKKINKVSTVERIKVTA